MCQMYKTKCLMSICHTIFWHATCIKVGMKDSQVHKLILVTRKDLSPGYQSVQPAHALAQFAVDYRNSFEDWQKNHKNLIVLAVEGERELLDMWLRAKASKVECSGFTEPDIDNELTAIALGPSETAYKMTSNLPLALRKEEPLVQSG